MLEETLDDPPLNVSCHVTSSAAAAVPPYDDRSPQQHKKPRELYNSSLKLCGNNIKN